jgi:CheY-like chemotaxis protein
MAHILLVEDEAVVRVLLADEFRNAGLEVIEAATADEAWSYLRAGGRADLVFSDVSMPGSMDGLELRRRVRSTFPEIKVIITSGNLKPAERGEIETFLPKPFLFAQAVQVTLAALHAGA